MHCFYHCMNESDSGISTRAQIQGYSGPEPKAAISGYIRVWKHNVKM